MMQLLAVSGSLRRASLHTALLRSAAMVAPPGIAVTLFEQIGALPLFNPDIEHDDSAPVTAWRSALRACDAILIACPEYAHGVPGAFKNALDWVVGDAELGSKPVGLINASARAGHAQAALADIVTTMGWALVPEASPRLPVPRTYDGSDDAANALLAAPLRQAMLALADACEGLRSRA